MIDPSVPSREHVTGSCSEPAGSCTPPTRDTPLRLRVSWLRAVLSGTVAAVAVDWFADALRGERLFIGWLGCSEAAYDAAGGHYWALGGTGTLVATALMAASRCVERVLQVQTLSADAGGDATALLLLLSPPTHQALRLPHLSAPPAAPVQLTLDGHTAALSVQDPAELAAALGERARRWNWLPLVQALHVHHGTLRDVVLLSSPQSASALQDAVQLARRVLAAAGSTAEVCAATQQPDFMDPAAVRQAVEVIVGRGLLRRGHRREGVLVNVTGGTKTASIAAAMATLALGVRFEYLENGRPRSWSVSAHPLPGDPHG